jgi:hypothetical protein
LVLFSKLTVPNRNGRAIASKAAWLIAIRTNASGSLRPQDARHALVADLTASAIALTQDSDGSPPQHPKLTQGRQ